MDSLTIENEIQSLTLAKNWRKLINLLEEGFKGVFVVLRILKESKVGMSAGELAKRMQVTTARIASALNSLQKKGYVTRKTEKSDGRKVIINLTEQGEAALENRKNKINQSILPMLGKLTEEEKETLFSLLNKILR